MKQQKASPHLDPIEGHRRASGAPNTHNPRARTRPTIKELYIIGSQCLDKSGKENLNLYSGLLINYLKKINIWDDNKESYQFGAPTKLKESLQLENNIIKPKPNKKSNSFICRW